MNLPLRRLTKNFEGIPQFSPTDATSNPSLVYAAVTQPEYAHLLDDAIREAQSQIPRSSIEDKTSLALDLLVSGV